MEELVVQLYEIGVFRFGSFTLKSGIQSPIYIDLRKAFSYPLILNQIAELMWEKSNEIRFDNILGVPLTGLVFASAISVKRLVPMIVYRKERKAHGAQNLIEGEFFAGQKTVVIEDLITSGISLLETAESAKEEGLIIQDAIVFLDRCQGGVNNLLAKGIRVHSCITIHEVLEVLERRGCLPSDQKKQVLEFLCQLA